MSRSGTQEREPGATHSDRLTVIDVEVAGRPGATVRIRGGTIESIEMGARRPREAGAGDEEVLEGGGGALIAGLRDHHLHLFSAAASRTSVAVGPPDVSGPGGLSAALRHGAALAGPQGWVRAVDYDESVAGPLSADRLDSMLGDLAACKVRVQHRSGHAWVLNATALRALGVEHLDHPGVARGADGRPTGVLFELDGWLRDRADAVLPPLGPVGQELAACGITAFTDASPDNGSDELAIVESACRSGRIGQRVRLLGRADLPRRPSGPVTTGQRKVMLIEHALPSFDELVATIESAGPRGVAIHCVSRETLVLAATAIAAASPGPHRIEHASVAPPELVDVVARVGVPVITQPGFVLRHGDRYLRDVEATDRPWLYRLRAWLDAGVPLAAGSDAPFGPIDPWLAIRAAVDRRTAGGDSVGVDERLTPEAALALFQCRLSDPGGPSAPVAPGHPADLCLLKVPWRVARHELDRHLVRATVVGGRVIWRADP
jgi:predicted amidohydrolase YtcJ